MSSHAARASSSPRSPYTVAAYAPRLEIARAGASGPLPSLAIPLGQADCLGPVTRQHRDEEQSRGDCGGHVRSSRRRGLRGRCDSRQGAAIGHLKLSQQRGDVTLDGADSDE